MKRDSVPYSERRVYEKTVVANDDSAFFVGQQIKLTNKGTTRAIISGALDIVLDTGEEKEIICYDGGTLILQNVFFRFEVVPYPIIADEVKIVTGNKVEIVTVNKEFFE